MKYVYFIGIVVSGYFMKYVYFIIDLSHWHFLLVYPTYGIIDLSLSLFLSSNIQMIIPETVGYWGVCPICSQIWCLQINIFV